MDSRILFNSNQFVPTMGHGAPANDPAWNRRLPHLTEAREYLYQDVHGNMWRFPTHELNDDLQGTGAYASVLTAHTVGGYSVFLSVPQEAIAPVTHSVSSQDDRTVSVATDTVRTVLKVKKKRSKIIGVQRLTIQCNGHNHIRLGRSFEEDLRAFTASALRDFYDGYGEKVSYVVALRDGLRYSKQMRCRQNKNGKTPVLYFTRERIVRDVVKVTKDFLKTHLDYHVHPAFYGWPAGATIDNFALVELRKISRASVEIIFQYCPSG